MGFAPLKHRRFIKRERARMVKMAAGTLLRGPAGAKNNRALPCRDARHFQLFESGGGHGWRVLPRGNSAGGPTFGLAKFAVGRIVRELELEKFHGELVKV